VSFNNSVGTAEIDWGCIFKCENPSDDTSIEVEMNVDVEGHFHGNQDHFNQAVRRSGMAHLACYKAWYEQTYGTPFTMSA
jgi:hypothetical protein